MSEDRLARIESKLETLVVGQTDLRAGQAAIEVRLTRVEVIQEEMVDRIQVIAEGHATVLAAIDRGTARVLDEFDRRLVPLELAVRERLASPSRRPR